MPLSRLDQSALEHGDLEDLIPPSRAAANGNGVGAPSSSKSPSWSSPLDLITDVGYRICSAISYVYAYTVYSYYHRRTEFVLGCILLVCSLLAISGSLSSGTGGRGRGGRNRGYHNPDILHDWSAASSALDLKLGTIDHWCLRGGDDACRCEDPLMPSARSEAKAWGSAHGRNKKAVREAVRKIREAQAAAAAAAAAANSGGAPYDNEVNTDDDGLAWFEDGYIDDWAGYTEDFDDNNRNRQGEVSSSSVSQLDVVFLGDSITEQRVGKFFGKDMEKFQKNAKVFNKNFSREAGAKYEGLALGIAGDTAPNLLWRIMHGEMPDDLNPRIWWITIGTNDLGATACSEEVTLLGILRVVEEILNRKPEAQIVINSILPMSQEKSGILEITGRKGRGKNHRWFWPSIKAVNKQLQKFADKHKSVKFFDATDIFTETVGNRLVIDHTLIEDGVHPTMAGYKAWDKEIIKRIDTIEAKDDTKKAAAAESAQKQQDDMDKAAAGDITEDNYDSFDEYGDGYAYDDAIVDDMYYAAQYDEGDDDWLYAGQDTDDWR